MKHKGRVIPKEEPKPIHQQIIDECGGEKAFMKAAGLSPKQETLEELALRLYPENWESIMEGQHDSNSYERNAFIKGYKLAQQPASCQTAVSGYLYAFLYNSCIHESSWATVSLHYSKEGAEKAMQEHKQKALDEFNEMYANDNEFGFKFGEHEDWCVEPVEVLP